MVSGWPCRYTIPIQALPGLVMILNGWDLMGFYGGLMWFNRIYYDIASGKLLQFANLNMAQSK